MTAEHGPVSLDQAVRQSLLLHPQVKAAGNRLRASSALERQAGVWNNPEIEFEMEDYALEGDARGMEAATTSVRLAQTFELGGKRRKRRLAAHLSTALDETEFEALKLDVVMITRHRFYDLLAAQKKAEKVEHACVLAARLRDAAAARVESGKVSPLALTKANLELATKKMEQKQARQDVTAAQLSLGRLWGTSPADARRLIAAGKLESFPGQSQALTQLKTMVDGQETDLAGDDGPAALVRDNPDWIGGALREELGAVEVKRAKAGRIPDVTLLAGVTQERDSRHETAQLAISFPLPLFNRNQGELAAALAEADAIREERHAAEKALASHLVERSVVFFDTLESARMFQHTILPGAREAFGAAEEAYRHGKINFLNVLDAEKTLTEVEMQHLDIWARVHKSYAEIDRLAGGRLTPEYPGN